MEAAIGADPRFLVGRCTLLLHLVLAFQAVAPAGVNAADPVLTAPREMYVFGGRTDSQPIGADDADAQPLTFYKASGPSFFTVTTTGPWTPTHTTGTAEVAPGSGDAGDYAAVLGVTDGAASDEAPFGIHVFDPSSRATMFRIESEPCAGVPPPPMNHLITMPAGGYFFAHGSDLAVEVDMNGDGHSWRLSFRPEPGHVLEAGYVYFRDPSLPRPWPNGNGELLLFRDGSGSSGRIDSYEIREVVYAPDDRVISFWATFSMECAGGLSVRGEIRYNANVEVEVTAPGYREIERAHTLAFDVAATDPDGGGVTVTVPSLPAGAHFFDSGSIGGSFDWTPVLSQRGIHAVTFVATDGANHETRATTTIRVRGETSARFFTPEGEEFFTPEDARIDATVSLLPDGRAGVVIRHLDQSVWEVTMGPPAGEALAVGTYESTEDGARDDPSSPILVFRSASLYSTEGGRFEIKQIERDAAEGILALWATFELGFVAGEVRYDAYAAAVKAFTSSSDQRLFLMGTRPRWVLYLEPVGGAFAPASVDLSSIRLKRLDESGLRREVRPIVSESAVTDQDENGVPEIAVSFTIEDLRSFFDDVRGTQNMTADLEAALSSGEQLRERITIRVAAVAYGGALTITAAPNPLNPEATITYYNPSQGRVTIRVFDVGGRLVRTVTDTVQPAGYHATTWSGDSDTGLRLASGVYYLRIDAPSGNASRSIVLMR